MCDSFSSGVDFTNTCKLVTYKPVKLAFKVLDLAGFWSLDPKILIVSLDLDFYDQVVKGGERWIELELQGCQMSRYPTGYNIRTLSITKEIGTHHSDTVMQNVVYAGASQISSLY